MSYFKAKMHQIRFRLGLDPRHPLRSSQRPQTPVGMDAPDTEWFKTFHFVMQPHIVNL